MEIQKIPLSLVAPSPMNPRKTFDEEELQELADNIEKQGLLQPITVRPIKDAKAFAVVNGNADFHPKYEIICGERRFRAFSRLSDKWIREGVMDANGEPDIRFSDIPAIIREMNDDEAFDAMITENLQRKDVDPIEEAFAFGQLIQKGKTAEEVAVRFGKSIRFVQDRIKLNNLIPELMLEVREERMSISSAMLIAKLSEDDQRRYHSQYANNYQGYSKSTAQNFVNEMFMTIEKSLWYQSDNQEDEEFEGGCGRKCSECQLNTTNHGCLFWEMKSQDAGRCTDRAQFQEKTLAYMLKEIDKIGDNLVKAGQPLEFGKTVLCIREDYINDSSDIKNLLRKVKELIAERGYEIVDPTKVFHSRCWYNLDDERTQDLLKEGQVYRCLDLLDWRTPMLQHERWYLKKGDMNTNVGKDGIPYQVTEILNSLKSDEYGFKSSLSMAGAEALIECTPSEDPLSEEERVMLLTCMLTHNYQLAGKAGMVTSQSTDPNNLHTYIKEHPEKWALMMRGWMFQQINAAHANLKIAEPMLDELGAKNCPESYKKKREKVEAKFNKSKAKAEKKLKELGYGLDGKPLPKTETISIPKAKDIVKQFREMKAKHPDALFLFRVGDFYECFDGDAEKAAESLKITLISRKGGKLTGFPHHALDTYLPMLVRAGHRVAICEQLEDTNKSKKKGKKKDSDFPTIEFVEKMREKFPNSLLLFHVGEYYECYDQDANDFDGGVEGGSRSTYEKKWGQEILINRFHQNERDKVLVKLNEADLNPQVIEEAK